MKKLMSMCVLLATMLMMVTSCTKVRPGYEGIKVNNFGSNKGVSEKALPVGMAWYMPGISNIITYPTFVQTVDYEPFSINAKDGSSFVVDPTISLKIVNGKSPEIFTKYRQRKIEDLINTTIYNYVRNAFRIVLNEYTTDELVSKREEFENAIEKKLSEELLAENFILEQMTSGLQYPETLVANIDAKNAAVQKALKAENEVKTIEAEAKKKIAEAEGIARALKIKGDAEAEYNRKIAASITPTLNTKKAIEQWDGKMPQVVSDLPALIKNI